MTSPAVLGVFQAESTHVGDGAAHMVIHVSMDQPLNLHEALALAGATGFSMGIELGLQIAVADIAAGRMLLRFYRDMRAEAIGTGELPDLTAQSEDARRAMADRFLEVLK